MAKFTKCEFRTLIGAKDARECKYRVGDTSFVSETRRTFVAHTSTLSHKMGNYVLFVVPHLDQKEHGF
jgi:hypothetical protein